jgi:hypothetical protein
MQAVLRYHFNINTDTLTDKELARTYQDFVFARENARNFLLNILRTVVKEAFGNND